METVNLDAPTLKRQKLTDKLIEKMAALDKSMEADKNTFWKMVVVNLRRMNPYQKVIVRKKINDALFETELPDYKQEQFYPMNEHFRDPIITDCSNISNMISG